MLEGEFSQADYTKVEKRMGTFTRTLRKFGYFLLLQTQKYLEETGFKKV
ncbi:hypothetical protein BSM4216_3186 [Bacillus smithii]|nr:hypothetical protein BSM4216_3186 [Bacillus smithii]